MNESRALSAVPNGHSYEGGFGGVLWGTFGGQSWGRTVLACGHRGQRGVIKVIFKHLWRPQFLTCVEATHNNLVANLLNNKSCVGCFHASLLLGVLFKAQFQDPFELLFIIIALITTRISRFIVTFSGRKVGKFYSADDYYQLFSRLCCIVAGYLYCPKLYPNSPPFLLLQRDEC